jgi:hypothetical protein
LDHGVKLLLVLRVNATLGLAVCLMPRVLVPAFLRRSVESAKGLVGCDRGGCPALFHPDLNCGHDQYAVDDDLTALGAWVGPVLGNDFVCPRKDASEASLSTVISHRA